MTYPDQQRRSLGVERLANGAGETSSYIKARSLLAVHAEQDKQTAVQKKKGTFAGEALVFRLARQKRDIWVTWPRRESALVAAQIMAGVERQ